jgi:hypothetical protein
MDHLLYGIQHYLLAGAVSFQPNAGRVVSGSELIDAIGYDLLLFHYLLFIAEVPLQRALHPDDIDVDGFFHSFYFGFQGL